MAEFRGFWRAAPCGLAILLISCGGDDDAAADSPEGGAGASPSAGKGSGGSGSSGSGAGMGGGGSIASGMPATELTAVQAEEICLRIEIDDREQSCMRDAVFESTDPESCESRYDSCVASDRGSAADECDGEAIVEAIGGCDDSVSVGELEGCLTEMIESGRQLDCNDAGKATEPQCLQALAAWCPEVFDEQDMDDPQMDTGMTAGDGCPSEDGSAEVDCEAFCDPLAAADCDDGPSAEECLELCGVARRECPGATRALSDCIADNGGQWQCSDGEPEAAACSAELECWAPCLDMIVERFK